MLSAAGDFARSSVTDSAAELAEAWGDGAALIMGVAGAGGTAPVTGVVAGGVSGVDALVLFVGRGGSRDWVLA